MIRLRCSGCKALLSVPESTFTHSGPAFSADERRVACWGGGSRAGRPIGCYVHVLDVKTGKEVYRLTAPSAFRDAEFTRDGKGVVTAGFGRLAVHPLPE